MNSYKLLTPGPLTTTATVKKEMLTDRCTWDEDYKKITQKTRNQLLKIAGTDPNIYTSVLLQGSGTFGVESVLTSSLKSQHTCLIITNGAYGNRMIEIVKRAGLNNIVYTVPSEQIPVASEIEIILHNNKDISHIAMVHCETTTGILNPLLPLAQLAQKYNKTFIVDAMSSFGGIELDVQKLGIDFLISSANKCIQGVPGFCFVIAKKDALQACQGNSRSLSLDLYDQWKTMAADGKWRYTSPTHVIAAFSKALDELESEGGVKARSERYAGNNKLLRGELSKLGISSFVKEEWQSPIISTFLYPSANFDFNDFYHYVKERGYVLYPGKLTEVDTFRIGNIGEIYQDDIRRLSEIIASYLKRGS